MPSPLFDGMGLSMMETFGERVKAFFKPQSGGVQKIDVIFNDRHQEFDRDGIPIGNPRPVAWHLTGEIKAKDGDLIEINKVDYIIRDDKPDGLEITELLLVEP